MAASRRKSSYVPQVHRASDDLPHIVVVIDNSDPIDLLDFTGSLTGLAREHEARVRATLPGIDIEETRLLITEVRKGSIVLEMLPALAPFVSTMEVTNTAVDFVKHIASVTGVLKKPGGRLEDPSTTQLRNLADMMQSVVRDSTGRLKVKAKYKNGDVLHDLPLNFHPAATGARLVFTPIGAG